MFRYDGLHFGEVIQASYLPLLDPAYRCYADSAYKMMPTCIPSSFTRPEKNTFVGRYSIQNDPLRFYRIRFCRYAVAGCRYPAFVNPKAGVRWKWTENVTSYLSVAIAGREPNRDDYVAAAGQLPKPEYLYDAEGGASYRKKKVT